MARTDPFCRHSSVCVCAASRTLVPNQFDVKKNIESLVITHTKALVWLRATLAARFKCRESLDLIMRTEQRVDIDHELASPFPSETMVLTVLRERAVRIRTSLSVFAGERAFDMSTMHP